MKSIAIIGGGLSGALVAMQLLQQATAPLKVYVVERATAIGRGVAYSTPLECHLLNVPVNAVSLVPTDPAHFGCWLHRQGHTSVQLHDFVPRRWFGDYVQALLAEAIATSPWGQFEGIAEAAVQVTIQQSQVAQVYLHSGRILNVNAIVLALGNPPPGAVAIAQPEFYQSPRYLASGWSGQVDDVLPYSSLLLLGAGLTAVDWLVALHERQYTGTLHIVSRHGLLPQPHRAKLPEYPADWLATRWPTTALGLLRWVRRAVAQAQPQGYDWRAVLDTLRPHVQTLWVRLPESEKVRFVRHLRPYWDSHRHRIAPQIGDLVAHWQSTGQLQVHTARVQGCHDTGAGVAVQLRRRGGTMLETLQVGAVVNCTGPQFNYRRLHDPLIQSLLAQELIRLDRLALGIDAAANGAVLRGDGSPSQHLYTLGPPRRGELWETIAVTEICDQAIALAQTLLARQPAAIA